MLTRKQQLQHVLHHLQRKSKWYKLRFKYEVCEMSKRLVVATLLSGAVLSIAPMAGIAEPTAASVVTEQEVEKAETVVDKGWSILKGAGSQVAVVFNSVTKTDERLIRKDEQLKLAKLKILELEGKLDEKTFVNGLELMSAKACVGVIDNFFNTQLESK